MEWFDKIIDVVETEYDRRIRKSSEIIAYGMGHGHHHDSHDDHDHACCGEHHDHDHEHPCCGKHDAHMHEQKQGSDDESAIIMNVPAGTRVPHRLEEES